METNPNPVDQKQVEKPQNKTLKKRYWIRLIAAVGIFSAISTILYIVPIFNLPIFSGPFSFLKIHFEEIPALIAAFAYGPIAGISVLVIKTLIKLPMTSTGMIGEFGDLVYSLGFIVPAALIYRQNRKISGAILALAIGFITQLAVSTIFNFYVIFPAYKNLFRLTFSRDEFIAVVIPFNAIKNAIVIAITLLVYKSTHRLVEKIAR